MNSGGNPPKHSQETDTLVRRLAGASVNKAGLALDQSEINRIIADASKGSKFYENEKQKDKKLTEKVNKILQERDEALQTADIAKLEADADQLIAKMEEARDLSQYIVHVDMDAFFANVEERRDPSLKGKPFIVGGGVVSTASYEARKYGCRSGMAGHIAKKLCPGLIFVKSHYELYSETSDKIMSIFRRYDPTMCPAGTDEAYLNLTAYCNEHNKPLEEVVNDMRQTVFDETELTVSAGIAPNKMLAKICSDKNKPNGQFKLDFDAQAIKAFMHDLPIRKVPGVGKVQERLLESVGIKTCGDVYTHRAVLALLDARFHLDYLIQTYLGIASNHVEPHAREERKSIGAERTFSTLDSSIPDLKKGAPAIMAKLQEVAEELEHDMNQAGWVGRMVTLKYKLDTYEVFSRSRTFSNWITTKEQLFRAGKDLLLPKFPLRLRLIGLRLTKLKDLRDESSPKGIKRFFESVPNSTAHPAKRRKLNEDDDSMDDDDEHHDISGDEHDELEDEGLVIVEKGQSSKPKSVGSRPRPPVSAPSCSPLEQSSSRIKPMTSTRSKSLDPPKTEPVDNPMPPAAENDTETMLECPICGRKIQTDNQGLNAHIDFCLSRGAIWDAQSESISATPSSSKSSGKLKVEGRDNTMMQLGEAGTKPQGKKGGTKRNVESRDQGMLRWVKKDGVKK